jgi:putative heme-binding domain-containing protein
MTKTMTPPPTPRPARRTAWLASAAAAALAVAGGATLLPAADKPAAGKSPAAKAADAAAGTGGHEAASDKSLVPVNLAAGKVATASSYQNDGLKAEFAVDGDEGTRWCAEDAAVPQWLQVDLGKPEDLSGVTVKWEQDARLYTFTIGGSPDGKEWAMLPAQDLAAPQARAAEDAFTIRRKVDAKGVRYVRLTVTGTKPGAWASVRELEVHGTQMVSAAAQAKSQKKDAAKAAAPPTPASVKAPAGWDVSIFAAPPEVNYPTTVCAAANGDVFVGIDEMGSLGRKPGRGRVVRLRDVDNDGKADQIVTVATMDNPRGVWVDGDHLYVLYPPYLARYTMGPDGVAVGKPDVLVSGITVEETKNSRGADHTTNGFRVGVDGWIYVAMGDFGATKAVGKDGTTLQMHGGGVVRVRLDGSGLEDYSFGQRNIYDVAIDPFMNVFTRDNTNDGGGWDVRLSHVVPTGNYGYPRLFVRFGDEIVQPLADYGGGSPCGALWVDEPNMPGIASGLLTVEWGASKVLQHPLKAKGAGYEPGTKQEPFLALSRPTDIDYDGRGHFYVTSWSNGSFDYSGPNVGYLARVTPKDYKPAAFPDVAKATDEQLVQHLIAPSMKLREAAQREILRRGDKPFFAEALQGLPGLFGNAAETPSRAAARAAVIFTLGQLRGAKANDALVAYTKGPESREIALRTLADRKGDAAVPLDPFVAGLKDADPRVRLTAAWGVGRLGRAEAIPALLPLAGDADGLVQHVAVNALVALKAADACLGGIDPSNPKQTVGVLRALQQMHDVKVVDGLAAKLKELTDPAARAGVYRTLSRLYFREADWTGQWWGTRPDTSGPYYKVAEWAGTPKVGELLEAGLKSEKDDALRTLVTDMQKNKIDSPAVTAFIAGAAKTDPTFRAMLVNELAGGNATTTLTNDQVTLLKNVALDEKAEPAIRVKATRALSAKAKDNASMDALADVLAAVVSAEKPAKELVDLLDETVRDAKFAPQVGYFAKLATADTAAKRELGYSFLVSVANSRLTKGKQKEDAAKAVEAGWEKPKSAASLLRAVGRTKQSEYRDRVRAMSADANADVARAAAYAGERLGLTAAAAASGGHDEIEKVGYDKTLALVLKDKGDPTVGKELFSRVGCVGCHTVSADEPPKGPFLGGVSAKYNRGELAESIMKPNAKIAQGFETQWFKNKEEDIVEGFVTREAGDEIELRNAAGVASVLKKADITKRGKRDTSIMPEGLVAKLSPAELASLIAYLETLKAK